MNSLNVLGRRPAVITDAQLAELIDADRARLRQLAHPRTEPHLWAFATWCTSAAYTLRRKHGSELASGLLTEWRRQRDHLRDTLPINDRRARLRLRVLLRLNLFLPAAAADVQLHSALETAHLEALINHEQDA